MTEIQIDELNVSTQFLEKCLCRNVKSFRVRKGTKAGENYMSSIYSIEVEIENPSDSSSAHDTDKHEKEHIHVLCKCFPNDLCQQKFLNEKNFFWKELSVYETWVPQIIKFQEGFLQPEDVLIPAFPPFISGQAKDFSGCSVEQKLEVMKPLDQYIIMMDVRKSKGFQMASQTISLSRDEVSLALEEISKIHAISWSFQQKNNAPDLPTVFPFLQSQFTGDIWVKILEEHFKIVLDILEFHVGQDSPIFQGTKAIHKNKNYMDVLKAFIGNKDIDISKYLRVKGSLTTPDEKENSWKVMVHGDYWVNNMLFRRNAETGKPEEVCIVDWQTVRVGSPLSDFVNLIYTSTDSVFQELYMEEMAELYVKKFNYFCSVLKTDPLPGFSLESFKNRLRTARLFGYVIAVMALPFQFCDEENILPIPTTATSSNNDSTANQELGSNYCSNDTSASQQGNKRHINNNLLRERIVGIATNLHKDGII